MRLDHPDYIKLVIEAYNKKRANNELSLLLAQSTPANIRRECLHVYRERYDKKDEQVLRAFFGPAESGKQFLQVIRDFSTDKFRPLDNYLKGGTEKTDDRNLELLAWLIDFQHRPFVYGMEVILNEDERSTIDKSINNEENQTEPKPVQNGLREKEEGFATEETEKDLVTNKEDSQTQLQASLIHHTKKKNLEKAIVFFLIGVICFGGLYLIWEWVRSKQVKLGNENTSCMYWAEDHYEAMPCNEERKDRFKLPMDQERMKSFKKILKEDTITKKSIGKVYYIKIDGRIEYYTAGGNHPVYVTRPLKPLSLYMFETYLGKQQSDQKLP